MDETTNDIITPLNLKSNGNTIFLTCGDYVPIDPIEYDLTITLIRDFILYLIKIAKLDYLEETNNFMNKIINICDSLNSEKINNFKNEIIKEENYIKKFKFLILTNEDKNIFLQLRKPLQIHFPKLFDIFINDFSKASPLSIYDRYDPRKLINFY